MAIEEETEGKKEVMGRKGEQLLDERKYKR
jgi:hypothetical protein